MAKTVNRSSQVYGAIQTILCCGFAFVFWIDTGPELFFHEHTRTFGKLLCGIGIALMLAAIISLRKVIQIAPEPRAGGHLVTSGVYRWFRHPIYSGILITVVGLFLIKPTFRVGIATAMVIALLLMKARFEEKLLAARYADYANYKSSTWGVVPGLRR